MHGRIVSLLVVVSALGGCTSSATPEPEAEEKEITLGATFDPATTGSIHGRVLWDGDVPVSEEKIVRAIAYNPRLHQNPARYTTPHVPKVHAQTRGVANAVVFLRSVDTKRCKPWDHGNVRVAFHDRHILVTQGDIPTGVGFVRRGGVIEIVNRDAEYHNLHGRGAAFFALPLLERDRVQTRTLKEGGIVDLTCGAGYYWMHAHLFVVEHPYYVCTDVEGRFSLDRVPAGRYDVVCWVPNWRVLREERDPETGIIARLQWAQPVQQTQSVRVEPAVVTAAAFHWTKAAFE